MFDLKYAQILQANTQLRKTVTGKAYKVTVLSNVTVNMLKEILEYSLRTSGLNAEVTIGNYDNIMQDSSTVSDADLVVIFYDTLNIVDSVSGFFEDISDEKYSQLQQKIFAETDIVFQNLQKAPAVIFNTFSAAYFISDVFKTTKAETLANELNTYVSNKKQANVSQLNIDKIFLQLGLSQAIDFRLYRSSKAPYTLLFFKHYVSAMQNLVLHNTGKLKKALIFDCDNTLWKGILGEDGPENIDMSPASAKGKHFNQVQNIAAFLSKKGVIIGICSKNNPEDVEDVLHNHKDMVLRNNLLVIKKVNWTDKATNLQNIAAELNIGVDALVFVDDSNFEINLIKEVLPQIAYLQVPANAAEYPGFLLQNAYKYFNLNAAPEDEQKTRIYKEQFERENTRATYKSVDEFLASLEISINVHDNDPAVLPRVAQLTQKTNQFNLTTKRYTEAQVQNFISDAGTTVMAFGVKDKFGDNGLTAVTIVTTDPQDSTRAIFDSFFMSCRIIGRNIEFALIDYLVQHLLQAGYTSALAHYIPTAKNTQVANFYEQAGFVLSHTNGTKTYTLQLQHYRPKNIGYISIDKGVAV